MNRTRTFAMLCLAGLVVLACNLPGIARYVVPKIQPTQKVETPIQLPQIQASLPADQPLSTATVLPQVQPTEKPTVSTADCLAGVWEPGDLSPYVIASIPPDMTQQAQLTYKGQSGRITISLSNNGKISMQGEQFKLLFDAKVSILTLPVEVSLDGKATGSYQVSGDTLTTSEMNNSGLSASAKMAGQDLVDQATILSAIPLLQPPYNSASFTCSGSLLKMKLVGYSDNLPPLELKRIGS